MEMRNQTFWDIVVLSKEQVRKGGFAPALSNARQRGQATLPDLFFSLWFGWWGFVRAALAVEDG